MTNENISKSLEGLVISIDDLLPLENNPRRGNVSAIQSSYREFGQLKPIVVRPNHDGTYTVVAGNHQVEAAKKLGWTKIAAVQMDVDNETAIAFALADNRTMELGHTDQSALNEIIVDISDSYSDLLEDLGWDEFELAAIEESTYSYKEDSPIANGYVTPVIVSGDNQAIKTRDANELPPVELNVEESSDGERRIVAGKEVDHSSVAVHGSTVTGAAPQAVVQYTIVFDNPQQQAKWYDFIRFIRNDPAIVGNTTAEKLIDFIEQHTE